MSNISLTDHLTAVSENSTPLWIDGWKYGEKLLNNGSAAPWTDVGALVSFHNKLQGLLTSDVLTVSVDAFYDFWLKQNPDLLQQMADKRRLGFALRTLLADQSAKEQLHEVVKAICDSNTGTPVLLEMSSPKRWVGVAHCQAQKKDTAEVSWDDAEGAAMYVADFLRFFSDTGLNGVLLRDTEGEGPANEADALRYQPVINVARHYEWHVVLDGCSGGYSVSPEQGVTYCLGQQGASGQKLDPAYFVDNQAIPSLVEGQFFYVDIPVDAVPERVLESLEALRKI